MQITHTNIDDTSTAAAWSGISFVVSVRTFFGFGRVPLKRICNGSVALCRTNTIKIESEPLLDADTGSRLNAD